MLAVMIAGLLEFELGGGFGYATDDSVGAAALTARAGVRLHDFDLSVRGLAVIGPDSDFNTDCCKGNSAFNGKALLFEAGYRAAPFRLHVGGGPAWMRFLPNQIAIVSGVSRGAPVIAAGAQLSAGATIPVALDLTWMFFTGLGFDQPYSPSDRDYHGSTANAVALTVSLGFSP
jgi:hypothetical protein